MKIDLAPIRRELFREMAPTGEFEKMTPEERQRVGREVNQRLLGIVQGFQITAAEIQNTGRQPKADEMKRASGRASRMPVSRPAMTLPTVRPRCSGGTRCAANGTSTCAPVEQRPMAAAATKH